MTEAPKRLTRDEALALDPKKWAVAISYGEPGVDNYNILGTTRGVAVDLNDAIDEVERERKYGDEHIKLVVVDRASIKFLEVE